MFAAEGACFDQAVAKAMQSRQNMSFSGDYRTGTAYILNSQLNQ